MDCSPPGSSVYGIFHSRVLEWGAIVCHVYSNYSVDSTDGGLVDDLLLLFLFVYIIYITVL